MASTKLYPPVIQGVLPAFTKLDRMPIPFSMNRGVSRDQVLKMGIQIKDGESGQPLLNLYSTSIDWNNNIAYFDASELKMQGSNNYHLKVQLSYINNDLAKTVGYYSTTGLIKKTTEPIVKILGLDLGSQNAKQRVYYGSYETEDGAETPVQYRYIISNNFGKIELQTNWQLALENSSFAFKAPEEFMVDGEIYNIQLEIQTINNLLVKSPVYQLYKAVDMAPDFPGRVYAEVNEEDGYVEIGFTSDESEDNLIFQGLFLLCRTSSETNYNIWEDLTTFEIPYQTRLPLPERKIPLYKDFTATPSVKYKYGLKKYNNNGIYTAPKISSSVLIKYQHVYLYDGERQLKLNFNTQLSNFTDNITEVKQNMLGQKYPVFLRNGMTKYKEFSLTSTVSYLSDEDFIFLDSKILTSYAEDKDLVKQYNKDFQPISVNPFVYNYKRLNKKIKYTDFSGNVIQKDIPENELEVYQQLYKNVMVLDREEISYEDENTYYKTIYPFNTNLTWSNFAIEKKYREEVNEFLLSDKIKLFKAPDVGNLLVRVSEVSYSPNAQLSRINGEFSCKITEMAECNIENYYKYNIMHSVTPLIKTRFKSYSWEITDESKLSNIDLAQEVKEEGIHIDLHKITSLQILGAPVGTKVSFNSSDWIEIGITGDLRIADIGEKFLFIQYEKELKRPFYVYIDYYSSSVIDEEFDKIKEVNYRQHLFKQSFGPCNILNQFSNEKDRNVLNKIGNFLFIRKRLFECEDDEPVVNYDTNYYFKNQKIIKTRVLDFTDPTVTLVTKEEPNLIIDYSIIFKDYNNNIVAQFSLEDQEEITLKDTIDLNQIKDIIIGDGVVAYYYESFNEIIKIDQPKFTKTEPKYSSDQDFNNDYMANLRQYYIDYWKDFKQKIQEIKGESANV